MEEHLGLCFCFRLQFSARTRNHLMFNRTVLISLAAKVYRCRRRGLTKHSVSETDLDLALYSLQIPFTPTEVLLSILLFFSWDLEGFIEAVKLLTVCQSPMLFCSHLIRKTLPAEARVTSSLCMLHEWAWNGPGCWNSNGANKWSAMLQTWKAGLKTILRNQSLVLSAPRFF